jgi:eukaryotic-like serine/threonine-protein kinase
VDERSGPLEREPESDRLGLVGSIVDGRYLVERLVGRGGFGFVYRATHLRFHSPVALKVLNVPAQATPKERERFFARFAEEGRLAFSLGALHPGIVRVFEAGTLETSLLEPTPYLAMEWLEGRCLRDFLEDRHARELPPLSLKETIELLDPAVQGLAAAHRARVAHCDVKPANVFLSVHDGIQTAKVLDFGLAEVVAEGVLSSQSSSGGTAHGFTSAYAAPEQWVSRLGRTGPWTDVHALALLCAELLCGRRALPSGDARQLMAACLDASTRPTPAAMGTPLGADLDAVFDKALALSPKARFRDADEFWAAFKRASVRLHPVKPRHRRNRPSKRVVAATAATLGALWLAHASLLASPQQQDDRTERAAPTPPRPTPPAARPAVPSLERIPREPALARGPTPATTAPTPRRARKLPPAPNGAETTASATAEPPLLAAPTERRPVMPPASGAHGNAPLVQIVRSPALSSRE